MPFKESFTDFFNHVKVSLTNGTFAKLTMAKTIGNSDLMNIYVRPILEDSILKLELKYKFQQEEVIEINTIFSQVQLEQIVLHDLGLLHI